MDWENALEPLLSPLGLELYDVEFTSGTLSVVVTRDGGVNVDDLAAANRKVSTWLDETDPISGHFTLDVSSPGLERRLRTPKHFAGATGEVVTLRERRTGESTRRLEGVLVSAEGNTITLDDKELGVLSLTLDSLERARTVFVWGSEKPATSKGAKASSTSKEG